MNNENRIQILKIELTKLFLSNNRPCTDSLVGAKASMISEMIKGIPTENLTDFFEHVRYNVDGLPSDARILKEYRGTVKKFGPQATKNDQLSRLTESNDHFKGDDVLMYLPVDVPEWMQKTKRRGK